MMYLLIIAGFAFLIKGADYLVDGAASLAKKFNISDLLVGLTIIAFGTSAPELIINLLSSADGNTDIAIGNVIGSNIANILLVLGIAAIIYPLKVKHSVAWRDIPLSILAVIVMGFMVNDAVMEFGARSILSRVDGLVLLCFFCIFLYYIYTVAISSKAEIRDTAEKYSLKKSIGLVALGLVGLGIGGKLAVTGAIELTTSLGVSQSLIGLTVVAIGTSLPELFTAAVAAYRKNADIAVGGIVGSNILNIFWVLGLSSVVRPLPFRYMNNLDLFVLLSSSVLLLLWVVLGKKYTLKRWQGIVLVSLYVVYVTFLIYID